MAAFSDHFSLSQLGAFRVVCAANTSITAVRSVLVTQGFRVLTLRSAGIKDKASLLSAFVDCFELRNFGTNPLSSWDAASDLIWQSLVEMPENKVGVLWLDVDQIISTQLQLFVDGLELLQVIGGEVERQKTTSNSHPVLLRIIALGVGDSFPEWK